MSSLLLEVVVVVRRDGEEEEEVLASRTCRNLRNGLGADWNPVVRSVGAFVGISFAIVSILTLLNRQVANDPNPEETSMAIYFTGFTDTGSGKPCTVVLD